MKNCNLHALPSPYVTKIHWDMKISVRLGKNEKLKLFHYSAYF